jgi:hypothetical protein
MSGDAKVLPPQEPSQRQSAVRVPNGSVDFVVDLDAAANQAIITARSPRVLGLDRVYNLGGERVIRVALRRK